MAWLRTCSLRSSVQNCSATAAVFHMEYSHTKGQYCEASKASVSRWNKIMEWWLTHSSLVYIVAEGIGEKESQFAFNGCKLVDPSHWHVSFDVVAHASCVCISSKVKIFFFFECQSRHMHVGSWNQVAINLQLYICHSLNGCCNWLKPKSYI